MLEPIKVEKTKNSSQNSSAPSITSRLFNYTGEKDIETILSWLTNSLKKAGEPTARIFFEDTKSGSCVGNYSVALKVPTMLKKMAGKNYNNISSTSRIAGCITGVEINLETYIITIAAHSADKERFEKIVSYFD